MLSINAHAKVNIFLKITGYEEGYHYTFHISKYNGFILAVVFFRTKGAKKYPDTICLYA